MYACFILTFLGSLSTLQDGVRRVARVKNKHSLAVNGSEQKNVKVEKINLHSKCACPIRAEGMPRQ